MSLSDPIADMLTSVRNALAVNLTEVDVPYSLIKEGSGRVMGEEGFLRAYRKLEEGPRSKLRLFLKYGPEGQKIVHDLRRESRPGRRAYRRQSDLLRVREGVGIAIVSTSQGIVSDRVCRAKHIGGEILCTIW
jgi:small subunit ribosomal protein S8